MFVGGNFGIEVENGVYNPSTSTPATAFILQNDVMVGAPNAYSSLLSKDKIDFTNYTKIRAKIQLGNTVSELELNVSGYNGEGYLAISTERRSSMMPNGRAILEVTSTKTNFGGSVINNLIATADGTASGASVYFLEITVE